MSDLPPGTAVNFEAHFREVHNLVSEVERTLTEHHAIEDSPTLKLMRAVGILNTTVTRLYEQLQQKSPLDSQ